MTHFRDPDGSTMVSDSRAGDGSRVLNRHIVDLTQAESARVWALCREAAAQGLLPDEPQDLLRLLVAAGGLPDRVVRALHGARLAGTPAVTVVRGNRVDDAALGPTPRGWAGADNPASRPYALMALLYASVLGDPVAWQAQQDGRIVTDIVPAPGMESSLVSSSSTRELSWHTEDAFSPHRADWVGLLCLRNPQEVPTTVAAVDVPRIPPGVREVLVGRRFTIRPDDAHELRGTARPEPEPVALLDPEDPTLLRVDRDYTQALPEDDEARAALGWLVDHLDRATEDLVLCPGDMAFVDNRRSVHGRRPFAPSYRANERWLKRVNVVRDLTSTRTARAAAESRVILAGR